MPGISHQRLLVQADVPQNRALAAFSAGVEIGHQLVVLPLFGALAFARRKMRGSSHTPLLRYGSAVISCCGAYYLVVALHEQFFTR